MGIQQVFQSHFNKFNLIVNFDNKNEGMTIGAPQF
jgi:hypothetical protein